MSTDPAAAAQGAAPAGSRAAVRHRIAARLRAPDFLSRLASLAGVVLLCALVSSCGIGSWFRFEQRAPWRDQANAACLRAGYARSSAYVRPARGIDGPGACGIERPVRVSAAVNGEIGISPKVTLSCPMVAWLDDWLYRSVIPAAEQIYGQKVVAVVDAGSYNCRGRNGAKWGRLSEHSFANALDVSGFVLADGRRVMVKQDWRGGTAEDQLFLRSVMQSACKRFSTVIGPDGDANHQDHLHMDLARHNAKRTYRYCK